MRCDSLEVLQRVVLLEGSGHVLGPLHPDGVLSQADGWKRAERENKGQVLPTISLFAIYYYFSV